MAENTADDLDNVPKPQEPEQSGSPSASSSLSEVDAIRNAVIEAAGPTTTVWLSHLFVLFYLLVAAGAVTHRDLLFENPVRLPFLSIDLPLRAFFWFGPALFLVVHLYTLVHFVLLSNKVNAFHEAIQKRIDSPDVRAFLTQQLPTNFLVQLLAGPQDVRTGLMAILLRLIIWITLIAGPVGLLVFFQFQFLPYHDVTITWWQRVAVLLDIVVLWTLWPAIAKGRTIRDGWRAVKFGTLAIMTVASLFSLFLVFFVATFPGEFFEHELSNIWLVKLARELLFEGHIDLVAHKQRSIWSNRIVLPEFDMPSADSRTAAVIGSASLRMRDLRGAVMIGANLRSFDFTGANLQDARLDYADLRGAKLGCEQLVPGTEFESDRKCVKLQAAVLDYADLRGTKLSGAQLQGSSLVAAQLQGAWLVRAQCQGASLEDADLEGATLYGANFEGATLFHADLRAAELDFADLRGTRLAQASLRDASLGAAQLQGADLEQTDLRFAFLSAAFVWRTDVRPKVPRIMGAVILGARITLLEGAAKFVCENPRSSGDICDWSAYDYQNLKQRVEAQISIADRRHETSNALERLDPSRPLSGEREMAQRWIDLAKSSPPVSRYEGNLTMDLIQIGCDPRQAPYILEGIIDHVQKGSLVSPIENSRALARLATAFLDKEHCSGARKLSESDEAKLKELR